MKEVRSNIMEIDMKRYWCDCASKDELLANSVK